MIVEKMYLFLTNVDKACIASDVFVWNNKSVMAAVDSYTIKRLVISIFIRNSAPVLSKVSYLPFGSFIICKVNPAFVNCNRNTYNRVQCIKVYVAEMSAHS